MGVFVKERVIAGMVSLLSLPLAYPIFFADLGGEVDLYEESYRDGVVQGPQGFMVRNVIVFPE